MKMISVIMIMILTLILLCGSASAEGDGTHLSANGIPTRDDGSVRADMDILEFTRQMGNGINLGNTMEACNTEKGIADLRPMQYETMWGQPVTSLKSVQGMKDAGFDTLRIPVAWMTNAADPLHGDARIDDAWLDRVEEIINYALDAGMTVIVNDHWDGGWWGMFGSESPETRETAMKLYTEMWDQIARRYAGYSDRVMFESANEELGDGLDRNSAYCTDAENVPMSENEKYALTNRINQTFVDTVRAAGGNNAQRFLLIAGYNTNIDYTLDPRFVMPTDTAEGKLAVSVHFYDPWSYCGAERASGATQWGTAEHYRNMETQIAKLTAFTERGIGVVIGEYGALPGPDGLKQNTAAYHSFFLDCCDRYDVANCLWDCSGLYKRIQARPVSEEIAAVYAERNAASEQGRTAEEIADAAAARIAQTVASAPERFGETRPTPGPDQAVAWLMWTDRNWSLSYSVGDQYDPNSVSAGLKVTDALITGPGTYTVGIDFTGSASGASNSTAFTAVGISEGERLYPGYIIRILKVEINGAEVPLNGRNYTCSDDGKCTRTNLYNEWIGTVDPAAVRAADGEGERTAVPLDRDLPCMKAVRTIRVTFEYSLPD